MSIHEVEQKEYDLFERKIELAKDQVDLFIKSELFTWQWWLLLGLTIIPWVIWIIFRDRNRQAKLLFGGIFSALITLVLDMTGSQAGIWRYGIKLIPSLPPLIPYDLALMPVTYMMMQQFTKSLKQFIIVAFLLSVATAFAFEPILSSINVYHPHKWKHIYSMLIYFLIFMSAYKISSLSGWEQHYKSR